MLMAGARAGTLRTEPRTELSVLDKINDVLDKEMNILEKESGSLSNQKVCDTHDPTVCRDVITPSARFTSRFTEPLEGIKQNDVVYYCSVNNDQPMPADLTGFHDELELELKMRAMDGAACNHNKGVVSAVDGSALTIAWDGDDSPTEPAGGWKTDTIGLVDAAPGPIAFVGAVLYGDSATLVPVPLYDIRHFMENSRKNLAFDGFSLYRKPAAGEDPVFATWKQELELLRDLKEGKDPFSILGGSKFVDKDQTAGRPQFVAAAKAVFESADGAGPDLCEPDTFEIGSRSPKCRGPKEKCRHGPVFSAGVVSLFCAVFEIFFPHPFIFSAS